MIVIFHKTLNIKNEIILTLHTQRIFPLTDVSIRPPVCSTILYLEKWSDFVSCGFEAINIKVDFCVMTIKRVEDSKHSC